MFTDRRPRPDDQPGEDDPGRQVDLSHLQGMLRIDDDLRARFTSLSAEVRTLDVMLSEMGEMESLRLQMAMDRMAKMMATLSNMLKLMSETAQDIVRNIK
jgi:hypothetical protein